MSRYDNRFKDDLYDSLRYGFDESGMNVHQYITMLLEMIADLCKELFWMMENKK